MRFTAVKRLALAALLPLLIGCPVGGNDIMLGLWLMSIDNDDDFVGFSLLANGQVEEYDANTKPPGADSVFGTPVTWQQNGNEFVLLQDGTTFDRYFAGTIQSPTYVTGTWMHIGGPNQSGTFVATKAPAF